MSNDPIFRNKFIPNLPMVKKIKLMKLFSNKNNTNLNEMVKKEFSLKQKFISLHEIIPISNSENLLFDLTSGLYVNTFYCYKVVELEIEEYDYLRLFFEENIVKSVKIYERSKLEINTFFCNKNIEIEILENDLQKLIELPLNLIKYNSSLNFYNLLKKEENLNLKDILSIPQYNEYYCKVKELFRNSGKTNNLNFFFSGASNCGKKTILTKLADKFGLNYFVKDLNEINKIEKLITFIKKLEFFSPCIVNLKNFSRISELLKNNETSWGEISYLINFSHKNKMILVFNVSNIKDVDQNFRSLVDFNFEVSIPNLKSRTEILQLILKNLFENSLITLNSNVYTKFEKQVNRFNPKLNFIDLCKITENEFEDLGKLTVGKDITELKNLCLSAFELYIQDLKNLKNGNLSDNKNFLYFAKKYLNNSFHKLKSSKISEEKNTTSSIPEIKWEDVGGLENAKGDIYDTIQLPLKYPKLFENGMKRRTGLLLFGPPGSGKTLLAKAIANECSMNFMSIKGPELLNMFVGESEKNIREIFEKGRENRPCVLFFDEIDALAPARSKNTDSNNVMDRIVAQFMSEMDGLTKENDLIIIASTNRPDLLDVSLLRPGRFDKMIYIGLPKSVKEKIKIYQAQTRNLSLDNDVSIEKLAELSPENYSGADIFAVCSLSFTYAMKEYLSENRENLNNRKILVSQKHFLMALEKVRPSLNPSEISKYEDLKKKYSINNN